LIPQGCRRLAEVDFPIAKVSVESVQGGNRLANPSTFHLWWARRPLPACRAMLLALLLPDPCHPLCPERFKSEARRILPPVRGPIAETEIALREKLFEFIAAFASNAQASNALFIDSARKLIVAAYDEPPLVVDSFAGGGAIPLESLRLGCDVFASDYNSVATLALQTLLEDIPRRGAGLADDLRLAGSEIRKTLEATLACFYPSADEGSVPTAYLWARTVRCESPSCGAEIPIFKSPWLCKKGASKAKYFKEQADGPCTVLLIESAPLCGPITFRIARGHGSEDVRAGFTLLEGSKVKGNNGSVRCLRCGKTLPGTRTNPRVQEQLIAQDGGADVVFDEQGGRSMGAMLLAVVERVNGQAGVRYRLPTDVDYLGVRNAQRALSEYLKSAVGNDMTPVPDELISLNEIRRISVPLYGVKTWRNVFTQRQQLILAHYAAEIRKVSDPSTARAAALALDRVVMLLSAHCRWKPSGESLIDMFGRHAIGMVWDFAEAVAVTDSDTSIFGRFLESICHAITALSELNLEAAQVEKLDACAPTLPRDSAAVWFTDPPYYDSIPYAHLSDVFYVWLKRALGKNHTPLFTEPLSDKAEECVVDRPHSLSKSVKTPEFYEAKMGAACSAGRRITAASGIGCVVFAHKTTEGWEALLKGILDGGWSITASWPIATELPTRLNARDTASLATSIHLVCRPRPTDTVGDWTAVYRELPGRVQEWVSRLQDEGVRGADLVFACIGPALEIYSRYSKVVDAEDREIPLGGDAEAKEPHRRGFLAYVWEVVGRVALEQVLGKNEAEARNGGAGALEEDSRLTALFLWTIQTTSGEVLSNGARGEQDGEEEDEDASDEEITSDTTGKRAGAFKLIYDVARRFAQPLGIHLDEWEGRIIETKKGVVRLLPIRERARQLFGDAGADVAADRIEMAPKGAQQLDLFAATGVGESLDASPEIRSRGRGKRKSASIADDALRTRREATTLDRVHAAMLLQSGGRSNALRALLSAEVERSPDFLRLANALSALYPKDSEESRLLGAMLLAMPRR
jgi:putative DNA methylase